MYVKSIENVAKTTEFLEDLKIRFQKMIFPEGLTFDTSTVTFGTSTISPLYRYAPNKNDLSMKDKSSLVTSRGIEPLLPG